MWSLLFGVTLHVDVTLDYLEDGTVPDHTVSSELRTARSTNPIPFGGIFSNVALEAFHQ